MSTLQQHITKEDPTIFPTVWIAGKYFMESDISPVSIEWEPLIPLRLTDVRLSKLAQNNFALCSPGWCESLGPWCAKEIVHLIATLPAPELQYMSEL